MSALALLPGVERSRSETGTVSEMPVALPQNPARRAACEFDLNLFCMTYFPEYYVDPSIFHIEFAADLQRMCTSNFGVQKIAIAAPRGIGKTTLLWIAMLWAAVYAHRRVIVILAPNKPKGAERLKVIKLQFVQNTKLHEDFPELTGWVREFGGDSHRVPANYSWDVSEIKLRNGVWIITNGLEASVPGIIKDGKRPDLVALDDEETLDVIESKAESHKLEQRIRKEVLYLHGMGARCAYVKICTIRKRACIADRFTDPKIEPSWRGRRYSGLLKWPDRRDLLDEFVNAYFGRLVVAPKVPDEQLSNDLNIKFEEFNEFFAGQKAALHFYHQNRDAIEAGGKSIDPLRLPLHTIYTTIAAEGMESFLCEIQNAPPEDEKKHNKSLNVDYLMGRKVPGQPRGRVPEWADIITVNIDVGMYRLHWQCDAWNTSDETSILIDEGIEETGVNDGGAHERNDDKVARRHMVIDSIRAALTRLRLKCANGWPKDSGVMMTPYVGADVGGQSDNQAWLRAVVEFCQNSGPEWKPMRGAAPWNESYQKRGEGRNYYFDEDLGYYVCNVNEYKLELMRAYMQPEWDESGEPYPGTRLLFGQCPTEYAKQQCAEIYVESFEPGKPTERAETARWHKISPKNHYLDTAWNSRALMQIMREIRRMTAGNVPPNSHVPGSEQEQDDDPNFQEPREDSLMM